MAQEVLLNVLLPKNRDRPGWLRVEIDGFPKREFKVLGRGSTKGTLDGKTVRNPSLSPLMRVGNTPVGDYVSPGIESTTGWKQSSYGRWGAIRLQAVAGEALLARRLGRDGLLIHGGPEGRFDGYKATYGCLRLHNGDMRELIQLIANAGNDADAKMCDGISVRIVVRE